MQVLNRKWKNRREKLFRSALGQYGYFIDFFNETQVSNFIIFNGRLVAQDLLLHQKIRILIIFCLMQLLMENPDVFQESNVSFY